MPFTICICIAGWPPGDAQVDEEENPPRRRDRSPPREEEEEEEEEARVSSHRRAQRQRQRGDGFGIEYFLLWLAVSSSVGGHGG